MIHLGFWQEVQGTFRGIRMDSSRQIVTLERIGDVEVNDVAINAKEGDVIAILRTDLPDKEYILYIPRGENGRCQKAEEKQGGVK